jgi:hypothetical protein
VKLRQIFDNFRCGMVAAETTAANGGATAEVAARVRLLTEMMTAPAQSVLEELFDEALSYGHSNGRVDTKAEFLAALMSGDSDFVSIALSDETISIVGDTALVRHTLVADTNDFGKPGHVSLKILLVWQKQRGGWKLIARQAVKFAV